MKIINIHTEYITLSQFLKFTNLISSGGEDKSFIADNKILVNEELETRRGRKLRSGDEIIIKGLVYKIG